MQTDWREPDDEFGRMLVGAHAALLCNLASPSVAVEPFAPILEALRNDESSCQSRLERVHAMGRELFDALRTVDAPVAMEIRHYVWHLQWLGESGPSSLTDMLMVTLTQFAHYEGHPVDRCPLCKEFSNDIPFQGSPGGREHFHEWLQRRS